MKRFILPGALLLILVLSFLASGVIPQNLNNKVKVFHNSLSFEDSNDYSKALNEMKKIHDEYKGDYLINMRMGWLYYNLKDYNSSKKYYNIALSINKNSIEGYLGLTLPLAALNEWDKVKNAYNEILKLDPNNYTANLRLGQIYLNSSDFNSAKKYLEKVYNLYPGYYEPNLSLGYTYYYLGDNSRAKNLLTTALMLSPGDQLASEGLKLLK
jgi:tetratricopeptide (TPR) repeat protein